MSLNRQINALEPLWWSLFGLGGAIAAFLLPAHIFVQGVAVPLGWISPGFLSYDHMISFVESPLIKLYLFALIVFPLFHAAHRIRLTVEDLRNEGLNRVVPLLCYGGSVVVAVCTLLVLFRLS